MDLNKYVSTAKALITAHSASSLLRLYIDLDKHVADLVSLSFVDGEQASCTIDVSRTHSQPVVDEATGDYVTSFTVSYGVSWPSHSKCDLESVEKRISLYTSVFTLAKQLQDAFAGEPITMVVFTKAEHEAVLLKQAQRDASVEQQKAFETLVQAHTKWMRLGKSVKVASTLTGSRSVTVSSPPEASILGSYKTYTVEADGAVATITRTA